MWIWFWITMAWHILNFLNKVERWTTTGARKYWKRSLIFLQGDLNFALICRSCIRMMLLCVRRTLCSGVFGQKSHSLILSSTTFASLALPNFWLCWKLITTLKGHKFSGIGIHKCFNNTEGFRKRHSPAVFWTAEMVTEEVHWCARRLCWDEKHC